MKKVMNFIGALVFAITSVFTLSGEIIDRDGYKIDVSTYHHFDEVFNPIKILKGNGICLMFRTSDYGLNRNFALRAEFFDVNGKSVQTVPAKAFPQAGHKLKNLYVFEAENGEFPSVDAKVKALSGGDEAEGSSELTVLEFKNKCKKYAIRIKGFDGTKKIFEFTLPLKKGKLARLLNLK